MRHYGPGNYQEVPARHVGDFGIEGYSTCGCAYQCYANQEPCSTKERYEGQRSKITADVSKFIRNKDKLVDLFGSTAIRRWILMTPVSESAKLISHASKKEKEVLSANLPYTTDDFKIIVQTDSCFAKERNELASVGVLEIQESDVIVEDFEREQWADENDSFSGILTTKSKKIPKLDSEQKIDEFKAEMIDNYLIGQNLMETFLQSYPDIHAQIIKFKRTYERRLKAVSMTTGNPAGQHFSEALVEYSEGLQKVLPTLSSSTIEVLSLEGMSDWLMRCPLDF